MSIERVRTGSDDLDIILGGGFPANSIHLVMGAPGTGKTILVEQLVFANGTPDQPALYLTTLSEPLEKFMMHGRTYSFFDSERIGAGVFYEDLGVIVKERGIAALPEVTAELIAKYRPKILVIDSFKALDALMLEHAERHVVIFDLATVLSTYECTTFLIGEYAKETLTELVEFAIADGVLQLVKLQMGMRSQRFLSLEKLRGSSFVPGLHAFEITGEGVRVFPRLLSPVVPPAYKAETERVHTGIKGLDEMVERGFWRGSSTLVAGPTGSGKTVIGLHFICEGVRRGEPGIFLGFQENPVQLARALRNFGWDPEQILNGGGFEHMYQSPIEMQLDSVVLELFRRVRKSRAKRVVIDSLGDLKRSSFDSERLVEYLYALLQWFAVEGVTCLLMVELPNLFEFHRVSEEAVSIMSDNIILLRFTPHHQMARTIRIIKTRNSDHDHYERTLRITSDGVVVKRPIPKKPASSEKRTSAVLRRGKRKR